MKKVFIEPQVKRIELNLKENIANSSIYVDGFWVQKNQDMFSCIIIDTGANIFGLAGSTQQQIELCQGPRAIVGRSRAVFVPAEEVMKYLK